MMSWLIFSGIWISLVVVVCGIFSFCAQSMHVLGSLLSLEVMMLGLFFMYVYIHVFGMGDLYLGLIILTLSVCEASLGLSLLISMIRSYGTDYVTGFSLF